MANKGIRMFEIMNESERVNLTYIVEWLDGLQSKYLIVEHDKDLPRKPHYHIYVHLEHKRTINDIAKQCNVEPQFVQRIKSWKNALAYAFHLTDNAQDDGKYQYQEDAVKYVRDVDIKGIFKLSKAYQEKKEHNRQLEELLFKYGNCEISKRDMLLSMNAEDYNKYALMFKRMQEYRIMKVRDRDMNVLYINGGSGSGKTTLAKYMARIMNYDFFVSGSGKDVLDGYDKEECIILDDLRADVFTKAELFKLTDNNTNSSVKSRFKNKDISYCKLMIITSVKNPKDLYNWETISEENKDETFKQFARRIGNYFLYLTNDEDGTILKCKYDLDYIRTDKEVQDVNMNDIYLLCGIEKKVGTDILNSVFQKTAQDLKDKKKKYEVPDNELPF